MSDSINFELLFESSPDMYLVLTPDFYISAASDAYLKATLTKREQIIGKHLFEVFPDNPNAPSATGVSNLRDSLNRVLKKKATDVMAIQKYDVQRPPEKGGGFEVRYWAPSNHAVLDKGGEVRYILHRVEEVTDMVLLRQERLQHGKSQADLRKMPDQNEKLHQAQRMEAMGQLAGGVAHDFNNILAAVMMICDMQLRSEDQNLARVRTGYEQIKKNSERAASLIRQLLAFSRKQVLPPKVMSLNTVITDLSGLLLRLINETITLKTNLAADLGNIKADVGQIEQVLLNIVVNARDAMPRGGQILIETANVYLDKVMAAGSIKAEPGNYVRLSISDTGVGMDANTQARIFEPFFTTKEVGKGTGLGLATVYGIVHQAQGTVWVYSELNKGTTFKIYLPRVDERVEVLKSSGTQQQVALQGTETVLVVEDQDELRELVCETLIGRGYKVLEAVNGARALDILRATKTTIDLVITDVVMPEMGGEKLMQIIREHHKESKVLFFSGYSEDILTLHGIDEKESHFLEKPFALTTLLQKVRQILSN
ncbi:MAG: ATP-binding protein [Bdellovibrionales bacterium]